MHVSFNKVSGSPKLLTDYLYDFGKVKKYFGKGAVQKELYPGFFENVLKGYNGRRGILKGLFSGDYINSAMSEATAHNIDLLEKENTLIVITGQQLGIAGGPLYTFYKILSAIKLAESLKAGYPDYNFVPVFWMAGDDHDFEEISKIVFQDKENKISEILYENPFGDEDSGNSVGFTPVGPAITGLLDQLESSLRPTEFTPDVMKLLRECYAEGKTFGSAFREMIFRLFDKYGLLILNPQNENVKRELIPIFREEILNYRTHTEQLIKVSAKLEEEYHAQVKIRPVNLFYNHENRRHAIEPDEGEGFRLKKKKVRFTKEELLQEVENNPALFSPNVVLRPVCQDYLMPVAFYLGGPAEISYFAQIQPLYEIFGVEGSVPYMRSSATIIEKNITNVLEKYKLNPVEAFLMKDDMVESVIRSLSDIDIDKTFKKVAASWESDFNEIIRLVNALDKTLEDPAAKSLGRALSSLDELKRRMESARDKKHEVAINQIKKVVTALYPNNNLQERELNFFSFANKYGLSFLDMLYDKLSVGRNEHQLIIPD